MAPALAFLVAIVRPSQTHRGNFTPALSKMPKLILGRFTQRLVKLYIRILARARPSPSALPVERTVACLQHRITPVGACVILLRTHPPIKYLEDD